MKTFWRDLRWILPASLAAGLGLSLLGPGSWWIGWLTYSLLLLFGLAALARLWRSSGSTRTIGLMLLLAVVLRLGLGIALEYVLPAYGNDTPVQKAGYIFADAYRRDSQAWDLAHSQDSLLSSFSKSSANNDQYGGLLFTSSLLYRFASPDAHRPLLIILLAALVSGIGVGLAYQAARKAWGDRIARPVGWILALFPDAVLLGASQMREPFLLTFVAMMFLGVVIWSESRRLSILWMAAGLAGLLLFHPGVAVAAIAILAGWSWLNGKARHIPGWVWIGGLVALAAAAGLFIVAVSGSIPGRGSLLATLAYWVRYTLQFDSSVLEKNSGSIQYIFSHIPSIFHLPLIIGYGILQPVLPAAIGDIQGVWPMQAIGILRGLGWFALLPFLLYFPFSLRKISDKRERMAWFFLWLAMVIWIIVSSARGGGDLWDNPRYRVTLLLFQAALAAKVLLIEVDAHARGLLRLAEVESVFVICFSAWTYSRYDGNTAMLSTEKTFLAFIGISLFALLADWLWGRYQGKKRKNQGQAAG